MKMITSLFLIVAFSLSLLAKGAPDQVCRIQLKQLAEVSGKLVRLDKLANVKSDPNGIWPVVSGLILNCDESRLSISKKYLSLRIQSLGLKSDRFKFEGPAIVILQRSKK